MLCALVGDVHTSPYLALVLRFARDSRVDRVLCVGDLCDGPGSLSATISLLRDRSSLSIDCVRGNHDRWLTEDRMRHFADAHRANELEDADRAWLEALPSVREIEVTEDREGPTIVLAHGLFDNDMTLVRSHTREQDVRDTPAWERGRARFARARWHVGGHTHERMARVIDGLAMINAGTIHPEHDPGFLLFDSAEPFVRSFDIIDGGTIEYRETLSLSGPTRSSA
jgi:predicted phosphodiesterase